MVTYLVQAPAHAGGSIVPVAIGGSTGDIAPTGVGLGLLIQAGTSAAGGSVVLPLAPLYDGQTVTSRTVAFNGAGALTLIPLPPSVYGIGTTAVNYQYSSSAPTAAVIQVAT